MIKIENTEVCGWEAAVRGMRNPKNSWDKSDSYFWHDEDCGEPQNCSTCESFGNGCCGLGDNDLKLMKTLGDAGTDHGKYLRMITVYMDVTAPLYWWKEFDTYKVGTVANSCSTMHKIHSKEFTIDDFSCEHLNENSMNFMEAMVARLNACMELFLINKDKLWWWQMIQLLPSSYNQKRTIMLNYAVLKNMYHARKNHKLDEWHIFCDWIETLPYSELITGEVK